MLNGVKKIALVVSGSLQCSRLGLSLLSTPAEQAASGAVLVDLLSAADAAAGKEPPEWVRFLAPGKNVARDGREFTVADPEQVSQLSNKWKGATDSVIDFEHQTDRAKTNGQPAPASAWITKFAATGPDGTAGIWAKVDWLPDTAQLIKQRKYRYLSAVVAADENNVVRLVPRASLTNTPAMDTASALFTTQPKEPSVNLLTRLLGLFGLAATMSEDGLVEFMTKLHTFSAAMAKGVNVELSALSAMTLDQVKTAFTKPLETKLALFATTAGLAADAEPAAVIAALQAKAVDPDKYVPKSIYDDVSGRLAVLTAEQTSGAIAKAKADGKITPAMEDWAKTLTPAQLSAFLATAPVIVKPGSETKQPGDELSTLSAEEKQHCLANNIDEKAFLAAKKAEAEDAALRKALHG